MVIKELRYAVMFTVTTMALFGGIYPAVLWGIGHAMSRDRAQGSLIRRPDGAVIGSRLIAQPFEAARYFHPRPSAVGYNAAASGGSNYAPSNGDHLAAIEARVQQAVAANGVPAARLPSEMVTASGAGLDPHLSPPAVDAQIKRVAAARGVTAVAIRDIVRAHVERPTFGLLGRARINVLELNLALDAVLKEDR